jgi:sulfite reductase (NADPH) flavoprotein alpha-component
VGVFVHPSKGFRLPTDGSTPMIMVGPGTGIAPFRAFLEDRAAVGAKGKNWLFFGDQRREFDFLYDEELEGYQKSGMLTRLDVAFSRDQERKIYVQQRMKENGAEIWAWLEQGAHFYVCGDARRMALDVDHALNAIIAEHGNMSPEKAAEYVKSLSKAKRYQRDVY